MKRALCIMAAVAFLCPAGGSAHSLGYSLEYAAPEGFFDIGYSDPLVESTPIRFDLGLYVEKNGDLVPFTGTWVRISQGPKTVFAGPIGKALFGSPGFTFAFPSAGEYDLSIRFEDEKGSISQHAFKLAVAEDEENKGPSLAVVGAASLTLGAIVGFAAARSIRKGK